jgi:hypothetical protein
MSRYNSTPEIRDVNNIKRRGTTILPVVPISSADINIETTSIERLDKLAYVFYDDSSLWWIIAAANGLGKGSLIIPEGTRLRIPDRSNIQDVIIQTNRYR